MNDQFKQELDQLLAKYGYSTTPYVGNDIWAVETIGFGDIEYYLETHPNTYVINRDNFDMLDFVNRMVKGAEWDDGFVTQVLIECTLDYFATNKENGIDYHYEEEDNGEA